MDPYTIGWIVLGLGVLGLELSAIFNKRKGDTLSEHVWKYALGNDGTRLAKLRRLGVLSFMVWLTVHFVTRGWM